MKTTQKARRHSLSKGTMAELFRLDRKIQQSVTEAAEARRRFAVQFDPGYVYAVEFDSGVLKVGVTGNVDSRLKAHARAGYFSTSSWVSARHLDCHATERRLIAFCSERGVLHGGREYFREVPFNEVQVFAWLLVEHSVTPEIARAVSDVDLTERRRTYADFLSLSYQQMHENFGKTIDQIEESLATMREGSDGDEEANAREAWEVATGLCDDSDDGDPA